MPIASELVVYVSGHLDLTSEEFAEYYARALDDALARNATFVVGDARGCDARAQAYLADRRANVIVFHMFERPRHCCPGFATRGGFTSDDERDRAMTEASTHDIAWVRPGRERSGTARNLARRNERR